MDIRKIKKLIELLEESGINELEITEGEESVRISRNGPMQQYAPMHYAAAPMQQFDQVHRPDHPVMIDYVTDGQYASLRCE